MTPKMQEALDKLATFPERGLPKGAFHHSTVTALLKSGAVEVVPGDATSIRVKVADVASELPRRDPAAPVIPIDDEVIGAGRHADFISTTATPKAWIMACASCKMPMVANPVHLPGCETLRQPTESVADAAAWVCRNRVKATRVSRRRAQRRAMAR